MESLPDYDIVLQLSSDVLNNAQTRVINASLLTDIALARPVSRVLARTVPPFQMKAHWAKPELNIAKEVVSLSANVEGGARYAIEGINLTLKGKVKAKCRPIMVINDDGRPVIRLAAPSPPELQLVDLKLSYKADDGLTRVDTAVERTLLRPTLCEQLMAPLADLPLNYMPDAVPLLLIEKPGHPVSPTDGIKLADGAVSLDPHADSLTLVMRCAAHTDAPQPPPNLLPEHTKANAVLALSQTGLNRILGWLCTQGLATGVTQQADGSVSWRWAHVAVTFTDHGIHVTGQLWEDQTVTVVDTEMQCSLTSTAQLSVQLTGPAPHPVGADVLIDAWASLLRKVFYAATRPPEVARPVGAEIGSAQPLLQRFVISGTDLSTEAPAVALELRHQYLVALYALPPDKHPLALSLKEKKPEPTITQPVVPIQEAPGAPVTVHLVAALVGSLEPPYDYAWRTDHQRHLGLHHSSTLTVIKTPLPAAATGAPHKLATVDLKVIDILGQLGKVEAYAMYYPAETLDQRSTPTNPPQLYKTWWDRTKEATVVARVIGLAVAVAIMVFLAFQSYSVLNVPTRTVHEEQPPPPVKQPAPSVEQPPPPVKQPAPPVEQPPPPVKQPAPPVEQPPPPVKQPAPPVEQPPPPLRQPPPPVEQPPPAAERPPRPAERPPRPAERPPRSAERPPRSAERPPPGYGESSSGYGQSPSGSGESSSGPGQSPSGSGESSSGPGQSPSGSGESSSGPGQSPSGSGQSSGRVASAV